MQKSIFRATALTLLMTTAGFAFAASGALPVEKLSADVVVVGAGGTGVAAAASAAQHGAKVIVFEKMPFIGGSSALAGGAIAAGDTKPQARAGEKETTSEGFMKIWLNDQKRSYRGGSKAYPDEALVKSMTFAFTDTINWLEEVVGHTFGFVIKNVKLYLDKMGVPVRTATPVTDLIQNDKGEVVGVKASDKKTVYEVSAKAVVLATGGFAHNKEMMERLVPVYAPYTDKSVATVGATGDGIRMAVKAGGVEYEDAWVIGLYVSGAKPEYSKTFTSKDKYKDRVFVNEKGERTVEVKIVREVPARRQLNFAFIIMFVLIAAGAYMALAGTWNVVAELMKAAAARRETGILLAMGLCGALGYALIAAGGVILARCVKRKEYLFKKLSAE